MEFEEAFQSLTGNPPFPWQRTLYERFLIGEIPSSCNLPTGLGKTSVVAIWLIALAQKSEGIPRRLVYVVNRRTVVDQTTSEVERYREVLRTNALLRPVRERLTKLCALPLEAKDGEPLALSTLRGQFADNREWSVDPARPAVIVGTVDMIGSRLLFSGYGVGFKSKPLHAGFLGQDVLLVHDEAHLEPAFQTLLRRIEQEQDFGERTEKLTWPRLRVTALSATSRSGHDCEQEVPFGLQPEEVNVPDVIPEPPKKPVEHVWARLKAKKGIVFHATARTEVASMIGALARDRWKDSGTAVLVFVRTIKDVKAVERILTDTKKGVREDQVCILTGTLRGRQRDRLATENKVFARFLPDPKCEQQPGTVYLVCTSAGEVGVDISADHLVCDLTTLDSMAQRFGRVNRRGGGQSEIDVVYESDPDPKPKNKILEEARWKTKRILDNDPLPLCNWTDSEGTTRRDVSPLALRDRFHSEDQAEKERLDRERNEAFSPPPAILTATDILFDSWAMTSIQGDMPGRPEVGPYLHGIAEELPQTTIAWRAEMTLMPDDDRSAQKTLWAIFSKHRIRPHETVTIPSYQVVDFLKETTRKREELKATRVALLFARQLVPTTIDKLIGNPGPLYGEPTLILPESFGCLDDKGMLSAEAISVEQAENEPHRRLDIADEKGYEPDRALPSRARVLIKRRDERWTAEPLIPETQIATLPDGDFETSTELVNELRGDQYRVRLVQPIKYDPDDDDQVVEALVVLSPLYQQKPPEKQYLDEHVGNVVKAAELIAAKLNLSQPFREALRFAAKWHDEGKKADLWQRYIGRTKDEAFVGKSAKWRDPKKLARYRHEFGSLLRLEHKRSELHPADCDLPDDPHIRDLALHLIAAHHGHARPHFSHSFDKEFSAPECEATHLETIRRFARLQRQYGRWGLAYLESLLRAADAAASAGLETDDELEDDNGGDA